MPLKNDWANGDTFTPAAANDMADAVNAIATETVFVENYRDGVRTDNQILVAAFNALAAGGEIKFEPGVTYTLTSTLAPNLTAKPGVTINGQGATLTGAITTLFSPAGTRFLGSEPTLTAAVTARTKTLTVDSTAALQVGDLVNIYSDGEVYDADSGTGGATKNEVAQVRAIVSGTVVELEGRTWNTYSLTGYTVKLAHYRPMRNVTIKDLTVQSANRITLDTVGIQANYFFALTFDNVKARGFTTSGIYAYGGINVSYLNCHAIECSAETFSSSGANGYGFWVQSTVGSKFIGCYGRRNRHTIDAHNSFDMLYMGCTAENDRSASFSTHGTSNTKIIGCTSRESGGGIVVRGTNNTIIGNQILGMITTAESGNQSYGSGIIVGLDAGGRGGLCGTNLIIQNNFIDITGFTTTVSATSTGTGILINSPAINARISGNTIKGVTNHAIAVRPILVSDGLEISNNLIDVSNQQGAGLSDGPVNRPAIFLQVKLGIADPGVVYYRNVNIIDNLVTAGVPLNIVYVRGGNGSGASKGERMRVIGNRSAQSCSGEAVYLQEYFGSKVEVYGNEVPSAGQLFYSPAKFSSAPIIAPPGSAPRFYPNVNLASNPDCEDTTLDTYNGVYSTEQAYSGTQSIKITATGSAKSFYFNASETGIYTIPCQPGDVFELETYVRGHASNVQTSGGTITFAARIYRAGTSYTFVSSSFTASTALNGTWTKQTAYLTMPSLAQSVQFYISVDANVSSGEQYYFDQFALTYVGSTSMALTAQTIDVGSSDTTLSRSSAGVLAVEGVNVVLTGGALGTPSSGTLTNCTFPTLNQNTTGTASNVTGTVLVANGGTGATTLTGIIKGAGTSAMVAATAGTDYVAPGGALGTPSSGTLSSCLGQVADLSIVAFASSTTRTASSYGDFAFGIKLQRAVTFTSVTFRVATADASGNLVVELRKNGSQVTGTPTTVAAANQVAGGTSTGTWAFAAGDIITVYVTGVGTTPGKGLIADITGLTT